MVIDFNVTIGQFPEGEIIGHEEILKIMDRAGIEKAVVSTPGFYSDHEEVDFLYLETKNFLDRFIPFGILNPKSSQVDSNLRKICDYGFKGIRFDPLNHGYSPSQLAKLDEVLCCINLINKPVSITTGITTSGDPAQWLSLIRKYPDLNFILLGMGAFDFGYGCVEYAAQLPNIYLETSLQYEIQIIKKAISVLDGDRILFGSGAPNKIPEVEILKIKSAIKNEGFYKKITFSQAQKILLI
ncbi:amidohydrolase family protein [Salmonella enterica]|nr:amidohydrolase family protein [Salmonella enterica]